jgi:hypothetical protein
MLQGDVLMFLVFMTVFSWDHMSADGRAKGGIRDLTHRADLAKLPAGTHPAGLNRTMNGQEAQQRQGERLAAQSYRHGRRICWHCRSNVVV